MFNNKSLIMLKNTHNDYHLQYASRAEEVLEGLTEIECSLGSLESADKIWLVKDKFLTWGVWP